MTHLPGETTRVMHGALNYAELARLGLDHRTPLCAAPFLERQQSGPGSGKGRPC